MPQARDAQDLAELNDHQLNDLEKMASLQRGLRAAQDSEPGTVDLFCRDHPRKVGEARVDGMGNVFLRAKKRIGKGSQRAQQSGGRLVDQGIEVQVTWRSTAASSFDAQKEQRNWHRHVSLIGVSLIRPVGIYKCPYGHWVGTEDIEKLVEGILKVLELGEHKLPLPPIAEAEVERMQVRDVAVPGAIENLIPMDPVNGTDRQSA